MIISTKIIYWQCSYHCRWLKSSMLKTVLQRQTQHVKCHTWGGNKLNHVYSKTIYNHHHSHKRVIKQAHSVVCLPHLGLSDHISWLLVPAYIPIRRRSKPPTKSVQICPEGAFSQLRDCSEQTNWNESHELAVYTQPVLFYMSSCTDTVSITKHIWINHNQKPWMSKEVQALLKACDAAFKLGDREANQVHKQTKRALYREHQASVAGSIADHQLKRQQHRQKRHWLRSLTVFLPDLKRSLYPLAHASLSQALTHCLRRNVKRDSY